MDIDRAITELKAQQDAADRISQRGAACLGFARLAAAALEPEETAHLAQCVRCATLRQRLQAAQCGDRPEGGPELFASAPRRRRSLILPAVCAACLAIALWVQGSGRRAHQALRTEVLAMTPDLDGALQVLAQAQRATPDSPRATVVIQNQLLQTALEQLVEDVERTIAAAREGGP